MLDERENPVVTWQSKTKGFLRLVRWMYSGFSRGPENDAKGEEMTEIEILHTDYVYSSFDGGWYIQQDTKANGKHLMRTSRKIYPSSQSAGDAFANKTVRWTKWS